MREQLFLTIDKVYHTIGQPLDNGEVCGGDSVNWMGHFIYLSQATTWPISKYADVFECKAHPGHWVRHPDPNQLASYCNGQWDGNLSRDQMTGILCAVGKAKAYRILWRIFWEHLKRGLIFANNTVKNGQDPYKNMSRKIPDITFMEIWALYVRGFAPFTWLLYPLLCIFDLHLFISSIFESREKDSDVISHLIKLIFACERMPTPFSWLARKITSKDRIWKKLNEYWCKGRGNCGMVALYKLKVEKYFI